VTGTGGGVTALEVISLLFLFDYQLTAMF